MVVNFVYKADVRVPIKVHDEPSMAQKKKKKGRGKKGKNVITDKPTASAARARRLGRSLPQIMMCLGLPCSTPDIPEPC
ncbi:uncharacterized protein LOC144916322 isoform X1 [Branchiostoma floridae x Branchiostoma belcheri]